MSSESKVERGTSQYPFPRVPCPRPSPPRTLSIPQTLQTVRSGKFSEFHPHRNRLSHTKRRTAEPRQFACNGAEVPLSVTETPKQSEQQRNSVAPGRYTTISRTVTELGRVEHRGCNSAMRATQVHTMAELSQTHTLTETLLTPQTRDSATDTASQNGPDNPLSSATRRRTIIQPGHVALFCPSAPITILCYMTCSYVARARDMACES